MASSDTKQALLDAGARLIAEKGYHATGIQEVLAATGVPKGSFYHYFRSKDDFGLQIVDQHARKYDQFLGRYLGDASLSPLARLRAFFGEARRNLEGGGCREGCLIGNLGQELADQNEVFRRRIEQVLESWLDRYTACFREAQEVGELGRDRDPRALAEFTVSALEGAILRAKVTRSTEPLDIFERVIFERVLGNGDRDERIIDTDR